MTEVANRTASARPLPHIVTELPGPKAREHIAIDREYVTPSLPRAYQIVPVRGDGVMVEDIDGNRFLDFAAGIAVNSTGHSHPDVVAAIAEQAATLLHCASSDYYIPVYAEVARQLDRIAPISGPTRAFLCNSGAEAVEAAMKLARYVTGGQNLVAFLGAFHGRTYGAMTLTGSKAKYHAHYSPLVPGVYHVPYGNAGIDELEQRVFRRLMPAEEFAAIFVEPIQGEGGYVVPEPDFLPRLRRLCDQHGILLVDDEIQSGMGRTGRLFAVEHSGVVPDLMCLAKALGGGIMPIGAVIGRPHVFEVFAQHPLIHTSTFGGSPLAAAVALEAIRVAIEEKLPERAQELGQRARQRLDAMWATYPRVIQEVRGMGLMIGIELPSAGVAGALMAELMQRQVLAVYTLNNDRVVRLIPPLVITEAQLDLALAAIESAAGAVDSYIDELGD